MNILFYDGKSYLVVSTVVLLIFYDSKDWNALLSDIVSHLSEFYGAFLLPWLSNPGDTFSLGYDSSNS